MFAIEDMEHQEHVALLDSRAQAVAQLQRMAAIPWHRPPHRCGCARARDCKRRYHIVEYDSATRPWKTIRSEAALEVSREAIVWLSADGDVRPS